MKIFNLPIKFEAIPFVRNSQNEHRFLLVKRTPEDGGFWQPITGTLESNESLIDCIYREMGEEINIARNQIKSLTDMFYDFTWKKNDNLVISEYVFGVELNEEYSIVLGNEHTEYRWCSFNEVISLLAKENNKNAFLKFKEVFIDNQ